MTATPLAGEGEELGPGGGVLAELAEQPRGDRVRPLGAGAADAHAGVLGLDHDADAERVELALQVVGDLAGQPLLGLHPAGVEVDGAGQLGQPDDALAREVADVGDADERQHVVLAQGPHRDVAHEHQLVVLLAVGEGGHLERPRAEQLGVGVHQPARRVGQVVLVDRHTEGCEHLGGGRGRRVEPVVEAVLADRGDGLAHGNLLLDARL